MAGHGGSKQSAAAEIWNEWILWFIKMLFDVQEQVHYIGEWGVSRALYLSSIFLGLFYILGHLIPNLSLFAAQWFFGTMPIWLPIGLWITGWHAWVWYIQALFLSGRNPVLLEMKIPREITKSPRAMELALTNFSISSGETTFIHRGWRGQVRPFFSMEIASFGGEIHFYFWCWKNYKNTVESALYAQYPEIELVEVEDYASKFQFDPNVHSCFCTDWRLETYIKYGDEKVENTDFRINAYPFKTYVDFELDKDPKEEHKIEPLAQVLEFMGGIKPNEQIWLQIVFRKCGKLGVLATKEQDDAWKKMVKKEIDKVREEAMKLPGESEDQYQEVLKAGRSRFPHPSESQKETLQAMERNFGKYPFEVGMRGVYVTSGDLHGPTYTGNRWIWRAFGNPNYRTHLRPRRWHNDFDYPWQDIHDIRHALFSRRFFDAFRRRSFYQSPWKTPTNVMTNEMLATLWHPPSATIQTPGIERIPATKASAPSNLPR